MIDWNEIEKILNDDILDVTLSVYPDELTDLLVNKLDFSAAEAEEMCNYLEDLDLFEEDLRWEWSIHLTNYFYNKWLAKQPKYPEDAPGQLHLFEE